MVSKYTCTLILTASVFTTAKTQKQPKCPPTEEWIKKTWYVYKGILFSHSQEWNNAICNNMDVPRDGQTD